jgi:sulfotransferase family protein
MPLSVIGAGFGRTGTMSLKLALDQLGFGPCYHMTEVFKNPKASGYWEAAADGKPVDWEEVFAGYRSSVDWPGATFYKQLADVYPEAKVILTVRDPEAWFESTQATIFSRHFRDDTQDPWQRMVLKVISDLFDRQMTDKAKLIAVYKRHNEEVRRTIASERLLVYDVAQGWEPLCRFLGVEVPSEPMPKVNSTEEFRRNLAAKLAENAER